jgi:hypothetical protein
MIGVRVANGTNAGVKLPPAPAAHPWVHLCPVKIDAGMPKSVVLSGHFRNCPACYTRRPGA